MYSDVGLNSTVNKNVIETVGVSVGLSYKLNIVHIYFAVIWDCSEHKTIFNPVEQVNEALLLACRAKRKQRMFTVMMNLLWKAVNVYSCGEHVIVGS